MTDLGRQWIDAVRSDDFDRAWTISDAVLSARNPATRDDPAAPYHQRWVWDGRAFDGQDVLVRCYHGLGDTIQFARYLPLLARRAASVTLEVQPRLVALLSSLPGIAAIHPFDPARPVPPSACDLEITELPFALREHPSTIPAPYLRSAPARLPVGTIGLCYASGDWDVERSMPPPLFASLLANRSAVSLVSEPTKLPVLNREGCPFDIDATAALVAGAALVITVDTMIAHLAGALGTPTWLLLKHAPDWRWPREGTKTVWYPRTRLYRQPRPGDWASVVDRVAADLASRDAGTSRQQGNR
jgi:hypothetical protein